MIKQEISLQQSDLEDVFYAFSDLFLYNLLYMGVYQEMPIPFFHHNLMAILQMLVKLPLKNKKKYVHALFQYVDSEEETIDSVRFSLGSAYFRDNDETDAWDFCKCWPLPPQMPDMERLGKAVWVLRRYFMVFATYNTIECDSDCFWNLCCRLFLNKEELCVPYQPEKTVDFDAFYNLESLKNRAKQCRRFYKKRLNLKKHNKK